jgi:hypothetical protein
MKWITREHIKVDRVACPWLIRKFVDPQAEFIFAPADQVAHIIATQGAIPFDAPNVELGHRGDRCSFDAIIAKYGLADPALLALAKIVRGADTKALDLTPESPGLRAIAFGFGLLLDDDHEILARELPLYDALYAWCQQQVAAPGS